MTRGRQAQRSISRRLSNEEYLSQRLLPVRIYHQVAHEPTSVHWHEFYEVHFILAGRGTHLLNETTHQLVPGTLFLLTPADFHALIPQPDQPLELFNVIFAEEVLSPEMRQHSVCPWTRKALPDGMKHVYGVRSVAGAGSRGCFCHNRMEARTCICNALSVIGTTVLTMSTIAMCIARAWSNLMGYSRFARPGSARCR